MVSLVDRYVGELMVLLDELGIRDNTVVFFHSDNGAALTADECPHLESSGPFRAQKRSAYEGGIRAPMLVHWRHHIEPGVNDQFVVSAHDALPTLAELAGASEHVPDDATGVSYAPVLMGGPSRKPDHYHYWEWALYDWATRSEVPGGLMQAVRQNEWKLVRLRAGSKWELYNLANDVSESHNLAESHPDRVRALAELVNKAREPMRPQAEPEHPAGARFN
jgi:arylsulfatase A